MTAPLSVNAKTHSDIEVHDSCNCCVPFLSNKGKAKSDPKVTAVANPVLKKDKIDHMKNFENSFT